VNALPEPYRVLERPGPPPETQEARSVFSTLFEGQPPPESFATFPVILPPGTHLAAHRHTSELAAGVVSGATTFVFGADGTGRVELGPGDYIWIREGVVHDEETADGVELIVAHVAPFDTLAD
jgi:quercetin dioxygenase-like cupin family protein